MSAFTTLYKFLNAIGEYSRGELKKAFNEGCSSMIWNNNNTTTTTTVKKPERPTLTVGNRQKRKILDLCAIIMGVEFSKQERFDAFLKLRSWIRGFHGLNKHTVDINGTYRILTADVIDEKQLDFYMKDIIKDFQIEEPKKEEQPAAETKEEAVSATPVALPASRQEEEKKKVGEGMPLPFGFYMGGD